MTHSTVEDMLKLLDLEKIEENIFRGESRDIGGKSVFGGQVLGQALAAAWDLPGVARSALSFEGAVHWQRGMYEAAMIRLERCLKIRESIGDKNGIAWTEVIGAPAYLRSISARIAS